MSVLEVNSRNILLGNTTISSGSSVSPHSLTQHRQGLGSPAQGSGLGPSFLPAIQDGNRGSGSGGGVGGGSGGGVGVSDRDSRQLSRKTMSNVSVMSAVTMGSFTWPSNNDDSHPSVVAGSTSDLLSSTLDQPSADLTSLGMGSAPGVKKIHQQQSQPQQPQRQPHPPPPKHPPQRLQFQLPDDVPLMQGTALESDGIEGYPSSIIGQDLGLGLDNGDGSLTFDLEGGSEIDPRDIPMALAMVEIPTFETLARRSPIASRELYQVDVLGRGLEGMDKLTGQDPEDSFIDVNGATEKARFVSYNSANNPWILPLGGSDSVSSVDTQGLGLGLDASESFHTQISRDPGPAMPIVMTKGAVKITTKSPRFPDAAKELPSTLVNRAKLLVGFSDDLGSSSDEEDEGKGRHGQGKTAHHKEGNKEGNREGSREKKTTLGKYNMMNNVSALSLPSAFRTSQEVEVQQVRTEAEQKRISTRWRRMQGIGIGKEAGDDPPELALSAIFTSKGN